MLLNASISAKKSAWLKNISRLAQTSADLFCPVWVTRLSAGLRPRFDILAPAVRTILMVAACGMTLPAVATPDYLSYYALGRDTPPENVDAIHINVCKTLGELLGGDMVDFGE